MKLVIRLNRKYYDERKFIQAGIDHAELYFLDGSTPPPQILARFLQLCESVDGAVAVHCKAGLGRTGTCIGCYMMKHYRLTAAEAIGWMRICRPGSVIGPQQQYLESMQSIMWREGEKFQAEQGLEQSLPTPSSVATTPPCDDASPVAGKPHSPQHRQNYSSQRDAHYRHHDRQQPARKLSFGQSPLTVSPPRTASRRASSNERASARHSSALVPPLISSMNGHSGRSSAPRPAFAKASSTTGSRDSSVLAPISPSQPGRGSPLAHYSNSGAVSAVSSGRRLSSGLSPLAKTGNQTSSSGAQGTRKGSVGGRSDSGSASKTQGDLLRARRAQAAGGGGRQTALPPYIR